MTDSDEAKAAYKEDWRKMNHKLDDEIDIGAIELQAAAENQIEQDNAAFAAMSKTLRTLADKLDAGERIEIFCMTYLLKGEQVGTPTIDSVVSSPIIMLGMLDIFHADFRDKLTK